MYYYLIVNDWYVSRWQRNGSDTADEVAHVLSTLHFPISREGPDQRVDEVARNILLKLLILKMSGYEHMHVNNVYCFRVLWSSGYIRQNKILLAMLVLLYMLKQLV